MSDYSKTTNFTAKDGLTTGDPNKLIKGTDFDTEFDAIATSSATKANKISSATVNNVIKQTASGDLEDAGYKFSELSGDVTVTTAELNTLDGLTSTTAELNILDGVTATAAELNYCDGVTSNIQTQLDAKAPVYDGSVVSKSGAQSVNSGAGTLVTFDTEDIDTNSYHSVSVNTGRLTVPASGVSRIRLKAQIAWTSNATGYRDVEVRKNGSAVVAKSTIQAANGTLTYLQLSSPVLNVSGSDYFELYVSQNSGSTLSVEGAGTSDGTWFEIEKVG